MRDHGHSHKRLDEHGERLSVEIVRRLIRANDVRVTPHRGTEHNFDLLTSAETMHRVVRDELGPKIEVGEVLPNFPTNKGTQKTEALGLTSVDLEPCRIKECDQRTVIHIEQNDDKPSRTHA